MNKLGAIIGVFILSFGLSILLTCILPSCALIVIESVLLVAAGAFFVLSIM